MTKQIITLTLNEARSYFNPKPALTRTERIQDSFMFKYGGLVRTVAKRSIKKRARASEPGSPPSSHTGKLRKGITYVVDKEKSQVWTFPALFSSSNEDTPAKLEYGGHVRRRRSLRLYEKRPRGRKGPRGGRLLRKVIPAGTHRIAPRPYLRPAKEKADAQIPALWKQASNTK